MFLDSLFGPPKRVSRVRDGMRVTLRNVDGEMVGISRYEVNPVDTFVTSISFEGKHDRRNKWWIPREEVDTKVTVTICDGEVLQTAMSCVFPGERTVMVDVQLPALGTPLRLWYIYDYDASNHIILQLYQLQVPDMQLLPSAVCLHIHPSVSVRPRAERYNRDGVTIVTLDKSSFRDLTLFLGYLEVMGALRSPVLAEHMWRDRSFCANIFRFEDEVFERSHGLRLREHIMCPQDRVAPPLPPRPREAEPREAEVSEAVDVSVPAADDADGVTCKICTVNKMDTRLNCGHMMCMSCVRQLRKRECPTCRVEITDTQHCYL